MRCVRWRVFGLPRGKTANAGGGVVGVPLGGRRTGNTGGVLWRAGGRSPATGWLMVG